MLVAVPLKFEIVYGGFQIDKVHNEIAVKKIHCTLFEKKNRVVSLKDLGDLVISAVSIGGSGQTEREQQQRQPPVKILIADRCIQKS